VGFGENRIKSLPDAIAKVIDEHFADKNEQLSLIAGNGSTPLTTGGSESLTTGTNGNGHAKTELSITEMKAMESDVSVEASAPSAMFATVKRKEFDLCPSCGEIALAHEEGCKKCYSCGYSEC